MSFKIYNEYNAGLEFQTELDAKKFVIQFINYGDVPSTWKELSLAYLCKLTYDKCSIFDQEWEDDDPPTQNPNAFLYHNAIVTTS